MRLSAISLLFMLGLARDAFALPAEYGSKEGVKTESAILGDEISFTFGFNDLNGTYTEWRWRDSLSALDSISRDFGLPNKDRYTSQELRAGFFAEDPLVGTLPDYGRLVAHYYHSVDELHDRWKKAALAQNLSRRQSIELLLVFLQDFPYGRPGDLWENRNIADLFVPPLIFKTGYGDCDSKSLLMATVLSHEEGFADGGLALILVPGHALLGIEMEEGPYDEYYTYQNRKYVVAEPTGLGRTPLGRKNSPYSSLIAIRPIHAASDAAAAPEAPAPANPVEISFPAAATPASPLKVLTQADCGKKSVLIEATAASGFRIQRCYLSAGKELVKHGPEVEFDGSGSPSVRREYKMGSLVR